MSTSFFMPSVNIMGAGCLPEAILSIRAQGFRNALIVTDQVLNDLGVAAKVQALLSAQEVKSVVFDGTHPNPTVGNVRAGLAMLQHNQCMK